MGSYAWYYNDHLNGVSYWAYAYDISATNFAAEVSRILNICIGASNVSSASGSTDLEKHQRGMRTVHIL